MPGSHCCVNNCSSTSHDRYGKHRNNGIQFFRLPKWTQHQGKQVSDLTRRRRIAWLAAIRRKDFTFDFTPQSMRVCSLHFHSGKPSYQMLENHPDWTPSLRLGHNDVKETDVARYQRQVKRRTQHLERPPPPAQDQQSPPPAHYHQQSLPPAHYQRSPPPAQDHQQLPSPAQYQRSPSPAQYQQQPPLPAQYQQQPPLPAQDQQPPPPARDMECGLCICRRDVINNLLEENRALKQELDEYRINENLLSGNDNTVKYYTGLPNFALFQTLLLNLTPYLSQGGMKALSPFQLVLLTLMRLRLDLPIQHLSYLFRVHKTTVADAFHHTLGVMYAQLCPLVHWPSRECLLTSMPHQFVESFGKNVAAIVDCFEVFIEKPSNVLARAQTFSQHKQAYTMKYLIVIMPQGVISFITKGWGGRTSDKHITEQSGFLNKLLPGDIVLANRGFNIRESVGMMCAEVKIPTVSNGHAELEVKDVEEPRAIAHLRIHVERVIAVVHNKFKFLHSTVPVHMLVKCEGENLTSLDKIVTVCCALMNMCKSVV
ncbi:uncharacterized protein LOC132097125 isoform X2 [Carassius carassius]|uniref:uncharacterized protein LOC132097125 isoform X2 n=1 Tax=Carassius carassius TaxID=217509 RepID=UPI0028696101|nr:uncharacterized protein LOC132097125 isoform X2 [Carassius carassius]